MLDRDLLQRTQVIVCHKNTEVACPDGVASAILLRDALPDAKVMFFSHDELRFALPRPGVLFCDICPGEEEAVEWAKHGAVVLDHHRSAEKVVRAFERSGHGVFADEREEPGVSGAVLAYREVWMPTVHPDGPPSSRRHMVVERFARLAGVRDTWQREDPEWRDACAQAEALQFWPWEEWPADAFHDDTMSGKLAGMLNLGYILLEKREQRTRQIVSRGWRRLTRAGRKLFVVSTTETSDAAELVGGDADLVVGFAFDADPGAEEVAAGIEMRLSLRSRGDFDCAKFCRAHGGGGHTRAAGCTVPVSESSQNPYARILTMVEEWETAAPA
jgi:oligoribonuclease NrnB/cAMP/cGMP phosphodiesterase (DHH superfamily)